MREKLELLKVKWMEFKYRKAVLIIVSALLIVAVILGSVFYTRSNQPDFPVFYQKGTKLYAKASNSPFSTLLAREYTDEQEKYTKLSPKGDRFFFVTDFTQKDQNESYTLRVYNGNSSWLNGERNSLISKNVIGDYLVNSDGTEVYYIASGDNGMNSLFAFNCEKNSRDKIADNVKAFRLSEMNGAVYYTTTENELYSNFHGESEFVADSVNDFHVYENEDGNTMELFYLAKTEQSGVFELFYKRDEEKIRSVANNVTGARFSEYCVGGSLYYFTPSTVKLNWQDWIEDDLFQSDAEMKEPSKFDYWKTEIWLGFIPKKTLDEEKYNAAMEEYSRKQRRDELRESFAQLGGETALSAAYDCYSYRDGASHRLAEKVTPSGILSSSKYGEAIVYEKTQFSAPQKVKLSEMDVDGAMADPASFFGQLAKNLTGGSNGEIKYAGINDGVLRESDMGILSITSEVLFSDDGTKLYVLEPQEESGRLYCCTINEAGLNMSGVVDSPVAQMAVSGANLYYVKGNSRTDASLYRYIADKPEFIEGHIAGISSAGDGNLFIYTNGESTSDETVVSTLKLRYGQDAGELAGQTEKIADKAVANSAIYYDEKNILFMQQNDEGKTLQWYKGSKKTKKLDSGVDKIFLVK